MKNKGIKIFFSMSEGKWAVLLEIMLALSGAFSIYAQALFIENITAYLSGKKAVSLFWLLCCLQCLFCCR